MDLKLVLIMSFSDTEQNDNFKNVVLKVMTWLLELLSIVFGLYFVLGARVNSTLFKYCSLRVR